MKLLQYFFIYSFKKILKEVYELIQLQAEQKGIELVLKLDSNIRQIYSDPNRLKQILLNLLSNALKYTQKGQIKIEMEESEILEIDSNNAHIVQSLLNEPLNPVRLARITISDTGVGIPPQIIPKLFTMYGTYDHSNQLNRHGVGLGLCICKNLVGLLGPIDQINVESAVGVGSRFSFDIFMAIKDKELRNSSKYISLMRRNDDNARNLSGGNEPSPQQKNQFMTGSQVLIFGRQDSVNQQQIHQSQVPNHSQSEKSKYASMRYPSRYSICSPQNQSSDMIYNYHMDEDAFEEKNTNVQKMKRQYSADADMMSPQFNNAHELLSFSRIDNFAETTPIQVISSMLDGNPINVLVVDDEPFNVLAFKVMLKKIPLIKITEAYNGRQALQKVMNNKYTCIFLDLNMPILDGYETAQTIRTFVTQTFIYIDKLGHFHLSSCLDRV